MLYTFISIIYGLTYEEQCQLYSIPRDRCVPIPDVNNMLQCSPTNHRYFILNNENDNSHFEDNNDDTKKLLKDIKNTLKSAIKEGFEDFPKINSSSECKSKTKEKQELEIVTTTVFKTEEKQVSETSSFKNEISTKVETVTQPPETKTIYTSSSRPETTISSQNDFKIKDLYNLIATLRKQNNLAQPPIQTENKPKKCNPGCQNTPNDNEYTNKKNCKKVKNTNIDAIRNEDVTVTRVVEKTVKVDKPITLYREFTTTSIYTTPIINYKITTVVEEKSIPVTTTVYSSVVKTVSENVPIITNSTSIPTVSKQTSTHDYTSSITPTNSIDQSLEPSKTIQKEVKYITVTVTPQHELTQLKTRTKNTKKQHKVAICTVRLFHNSEGEPECHNVNKECNACNKKEVRSEVKRMKRKKLFLLLK